ncbi:MAG TPA: class I SAM-dependent methyltransferase [Candidatus Krumholzibacteria bacterium]
MTNPWLSIPLSDYEAHMALPEVAQARLLADIFATLLETHRPASVAVIGCAGGNGFDCIDPTVTQRVVGVDINPDYIDAARQRHAGRIANLELITADIQDGAVSFAPVELIYAALLFEYVDGKRTLECLRALLTPDGILATVVQVAGGKMVTPTPYLSLEALGPVMRVVDIDDLAASACDAGLRELHRRRTRSPGGKDFDVQVFQVNS